MKPDQHVASSTLTNRAFALLSSVSFKHGPRALLARFFIEADRALRCEGIVLRFGTFEDLVDANNSNRDSWAPIAPTFDPANGLCDLDRAYALIGRNLAGEVVISSGDTTFRLVENDAQGGSRELAHVLCRSEADGASG